MSGFTTVSFYLISAIFNLIILFYWLRIGIRFFNISQTNSVAHMVYNLTNPVVNPINKLLKTPSTWRFDLGCFLLTVVVECIKILLIGSIAMGQMLPLTYLAIFVLGDLIMQPLNILFYILLIRVIMSYVNPNWNHPIGEFIIRITDPIIVLGRKIVPDVSGFDFSPFVMLILLKVIVLFITAYLPLL